MGLTFTWFEGIMFFDQKFRMDECFKLLLLKEDIKWINRLLQLGANSEKTKIKVSAILEIISDFCKLRPWVLRAGVFNNGETSLIGDVVRIFFVTETQLPELEINACYMLGMLVGAVTHTIMPVDIGCRSPDGLGEVIDAYRKEK